MRIAEELQVWREQGLKSIHQAAFVDGAWVERGEGASEVRNPADGTLLGTVPRLSRAQIDDAIASAAKAQRAWRMQPGPARAEALMAWHELIHRDKFKLAGILALENGKPAQEALGEVLYAASFVRWFAAEAERLSGDVIDSPKAGDRILTLKQPVGVVGAITPWNFPAAMVTRKIAPALAAGCSIVLKPASETPFTALHLAALALEAKLPPGVFNVVTGDEVMIGDALTSSMIVRKISFTGSTAVGRLLASKSAPTLKRMSLELGGAAPLIVFDDADLDKAVAGAVASKFRNAGQTCVCPNRIYAQAGIFDAFVERFTAKVAALKPGPAFDEYSDLGPLISSEGLTKVEAHVADALAHGGRLMTGGKRHDRGGLFYQPTVVAGASSDALYRTDETFGPFAPVFKFMHEDEAIEAANATEYGLAAYAFTEGLSRALRVADRLEAGIIGLNTGMISNALNPFGGVKQSGYGREGSRYGINEYVEIKSVTLAGG